VRTPAEFNKGHLENAVNIDWNNSSSENELKKLDPTKEYFVYCLSGGRSTGAAEFMRNNGIKNVYELTGGIIKWRAAGLPENNTNTSKSGESNGLTMEAYQALLKNDKTVVIDIFAEWCGPCKKMAPYLNEMQSTMSDKVVIIRIDADKNVDLCKQLNIDALPTVYVYKQNNKTFEHVGFLSKEDLVKEL
jgi:thioredoxin